MKLVPGWFLFRLPYFLAARVISYRIDRAFNWPIHKAILRSLRIRRKEAYPPGERERREQNRHLGSSY